MVVQKFDQTKQFIIICGLIRQFVILGDNLPFVNNLGKHDIREEEGARARRACVVSLPAEKRIPEETREANRICRWELPPEPIDAFSLEVQHRLRVKADAPRGHVNPSAKAAADIDEGHAETGGSQLEQYMSVLNASAPYVLEIRVNEFRLYPLPLRIVSVLVHGSAN